MSNYILLWNHNHHFMFQYLYQLAVQIRVVSIWIFRLGNLFEQFDNNPCLLRGLRG
jgi:hypothetical protein